MEFRILGPLEVHEGGRVLSIPSPQQRSLLVLLILNANRRLSAGWIADRLWDGRLPDSGTKALAFHVSRLRDALAPGRHHGQPAGCIETEAGGYVLRVDPDLIDAARFERLARDGHRQLAGDPVEARASLTDALALWRGEPLADVANAEFAQSEIRRLDELRLGALEDLIEADLALGEHTAVVGEAEALVGANPLREHLRGLLMLALYRSGRQAEALRVAGAGRRALSEELGVDPSPELTHLEARILVQDPTLAPPPPCRATIGPRARNPYKGLRPFGEGDAADFFGREALVSRLVARLDEVSHAGHLLALVGPSGSGKSSVVRAGLLPALRQGALAGSSNWGVATMVPGADPFDELAGALNAGGRRIRRAAVERAARQADIRPLLRAGGLEDRARLLLVIDQFEELFARVDPMVRDRFVDALVAALRAPDPPLVVVATLRADFLHVPLARPDLGLLLRDGIELLTPLSRAELERAIERPAEAVGIAVEPALVGEIVADVEHRPGGLPQLEYALTELFDQCDGQRLTREGYRAIGGVAGALGQRADEAWQSLGPDRRELARQVLLRLVALTDGVATARRVPRRELDSLALDPGHIAEILDELQRRGLLTFDIDRAGGEGTVEIAHEALLTHWHRLAGWIDDLRDDLAARRRLADAAGEWEAAGRSPGFLASGARLERFEAWARGTRLRLTEHEQDFLTAGVAERSRLAGLESARVAHEHRLERRSRVVRRALVGVLVAAIVVGLGLAAALLGQRQSSVEEAAVARARELANGSIASLGRNRQLSVLLALEAASATADRGYVVEEAYDALQWALQEAQVAYPTGELPIGVREAPDGPRGVFLVAPEVLMRLATNYVQRPLSAEECRTYLHVASCPASAAPRDGVSLKLRTVAGVAPASALAVGDLTGSRVRAVSELAANVSPLVAASLTGTGISVSWQPALNGDLASRIAANELPDLAIVARPSFVEAAGRDGWLIDLSGRITGADLATATGRYLDGLGAVTVAGSSHRYGLPVAASLDDLLWYPKAAFAEAGYAPPRTAAELDALTARLIADGHVPWCLGNEEGTAAAAWLENLFLDTNGLEPYDGWVRGDVPFADGKIRAAGDVLANQVTRDGAVLNGLDSAGLTPDRIAILPMVRLDEPSCWLYRGPSTVRVGLGPEPSTRLAAVRFPGGPFASQAVLGRVYTIVVLRDRPEVRRVVEALVDESFAASVASDLCDDGIFPVRDAEVPASCPLADAAQRLQTGLAVGAYRVRALDLLPDEVATAFEGQLSWSLHQAGLAGGSTSLDDWEWGVDQVWADFRVDGP